jgi:hypothetical protein
MQEIIPNDHPLVARVLRTINKHFAKGVHYLDAAARSGVNEDLALALAKTEERLRGMLAQSYDEDRPRITEIDLVSQPSPPASTPTEIKHNYLKDLAAAGLFDKSVQMVRMADPQEEAGARIIEGHLRFVVKDLWPRESQSEHTEEVQIEDASEEQLEKKLELIRSRREEAQGKIVSAQKALQERASGKGA